MATPPWINQCKILTRSSILLHQDGPAAIARTIQEGRRIVRYYSISSPIILRPPDDALPTHTHCYEFRSKTTANRHGTAQHDIKASLVPRDGATRWLKPTRMIMTVIMLSRKAYTRRLVLSCRPALPCPAQGNEASYLRQSLGVTQASGLTV